VEILMTFQIRRSLSHRTSRSVTARTCAFRLAFLILTSAIVHCSSAPPSPTEVPIDASANDGAPQAPGDVDAGSADGGVTAPDAATDARAASPDSASDGGSIKVPTNELRLVSGIACGMTRDANRVYWVVRPPATPLEPQLQSMPVTGGAITTLSTTFPCSQISVNSSHVFGVIEAPTGTTVVRVPLGGGALETVTTESSGQPPVNRALVADDADVYWVGRLAVYRAPLASLPASPQLWIKLPRTFEGMQHDATSVYGCFDGVISRKAKSQGPTDFAITPLEKLYQVSNFAATSEYAVDATHVYATNGLLRSSTVFAAPRGGAQTAIAGPYHQTFSVSADSTTVFFGGWDATATSRIIGLVPKSGGAPITVPVTYAPDHLVIVDDFIFWWEGNGIHRLTR
jgi:hypothetical protein